jgi:hypothetical protein
MQGALGASSGFGPLIPSPLPLSFSRAKRGAPLCWWRDGIGYLLIGLIGFRDILSNKRGNIDHNGHRKR